MNSIARWGLLALLPLAACSSNPPTPVAAATPPTVPAPKPAVAEGDRNFAAQAAASDQFEVQSSELALKHSGSAAVRKFAQHMIEAHSKTSQDLAQIAQAKDMAFSPKLGPAQQSMLASLEKLHGAAFTRLYLHDQVAGHAMAATLFRNEASEGSDPQLKAFARKTLPHIEHHLRMARLLGGR